MRKTLIIIFLILVVSTQVFAFSAAIQAVLGSNNTNYSKLITLSNGNLLTTGSTTLIRTSATENWNKLIITPSGYLVVTPSGYLVKAS